jgi:hypothetical protein
LNAPGASGLPFWSIGASGGATLDARIFEDQKFRERKMPFMSSSTPPPVSPPLDPSAPYHDFLTANPEAGLNANPFKNGAGPALADFRSIPNPVLPSTGDLFGGDIDEELDDNGQMFRHLCACPSVFPQDPMRMCQLADLRPINVFIRYLYPKEEGSEDPSKTVTPPSEMVSDKTALMWLLPYLFEFPCHISTDPF